MDVALGAGGFGLGARGLLLPGVAQLFAAREDMSFRFVEAGVDARTFDGIAGTAASHKITGILLSFVSAWNHEIDAHDQRVFKTGASIQTTIPADVIIAFENFAAFFDGHRGIHKRKRSEADWHEVLHSGNRAEQEGEYDLRALWE
jgi:hypothetical protein